MTKIFLYVAHFGKMSSENVQLIDDCNSLIVELLKEAGKCLKEGFYAATKHVEFKDGNWDLVTEYDRKIEEIFMSGIRAKYPDHK